MKILEALDNTSEKDLEAISSRIDELESELATLKEARKLVHLKVHGEKLTTKAALGTTKQKKADPQKEHDRGLIHDLLSEEGSMPVPAISERLGIDGRRVVGLLRNHEWFRKVNGNEYECA